MGKFLAGTVFGLILSIAYVWYGVQLPKWLELPDTFQRSLKAVVTDEALFDLEASDGRRRRALEIYFATQAQRAAALDADMGHPLLNEMTRRRAVRKARVLRGLWSAYDKAINQPELRKSLVKKHGETDDDTLKRRMLLAAVREEAFLFAWLEKHDSTPTVANVRELLVKFSHLDATPSK